MGTFKKRGPRSLAQRSPWRIEKWRQVGSASRGEGGRAARPPCTLSLLESAGNRRNAKETRYLLKVKAESFQSSVKNSHCGYMRTKGGWRVKLGNAEALEHLWRQGSKTSTRTSGQRDQGSSVELTGNPATETLRFSRKGPSHWPGLGHVWKQGLASCLNMYLRVHAQLCLTLCDPMDGSPPGSSVRGILQARTLEWVALSSCRGSSQPGIKLCLLCVLHCRQVLYHWATWEVPLMLTVPRKK